MCNLEVEVLAEPLLRGLLCRKGTLQEDYRGLPPRIGVRQSAHPKVRE